MPVPARVVCISHEAGAGGVEVAALVAERLGFSLVDEQIVTVAAERADVTREEMADTERRPSLVARVLDVLGKGLAVDAGAGLAPGAYGETDDPHRALITAVIEETAGRGDVVIVSHAASVGLAGRSDLLRALVVGSPAVRAGRLAVEGDAAEGARAVKREDAARADYLRRFHGVAHELPTHYDVVVNTDVLGVDGAAGVIADAIG